MQSSHVSWGAKSALEVENGSVVKLDPHDPKIIGKVQSGYFAVDGNFLLPADSNILKIRRRIRETGIAFAVVNVDNKGLLVGEPIITAPGCIDDIEDADILDAIKRDIKASMLQLHKQHGGKTSSDQIETLVRSIVRRILREESGKQPQIIINISNI
jgi:ribonuclease J